MKQGKTTRGFAYNTFKDFYGQECSIQDSSLIEPPCVWMGVDNTGPHVGGPNGEFNEKVSCRMHITIEQASDIVAVLTRFIENGSIEE